MSTTLEDKDTPADLQRTALEDAEKQAAESQPGSYRDVENADKVVGVQPIDADSLPIHGLDP